MKNIFFTIIIIFTQLAVLINSFPNKPWFLRVCSTRLLKTLREKPAFSTFPRMFFLLPITIFSNLVTVIYFVVYKCFQFGTAYNLSFGNELNGKVVES